MGNCLETCFGRAKKKTNYFVGRYKDYDVAIEFQNLIEDDSNPSRDVAVLTETERQYLLSKRFTDLEREQKNRDAEIDAELRRQEENLKIEEESYNEAKKESARIAKQARAQLQDKKRQQNKKVISNGSIKSSWLGNDEDWDVAGGEDDFEMFLDSVKARSQAIRANVTSLVTATTTNTPTGHKDSVTSTKSTGLEWEYEQGFTGVSTGSSRPYHKGENVLAKSATPSTPEMSAISHQQGKVSGQDFDAEWDSDFVSADMEESGSRMHGGMPFGGTDSEAATRTGEIHKNVGAEQNAESQPGRVVKSAEMTENVPTNQGHPGIDTKPAVQSLSSLSPSSVVISTPKPIPDLTVLSDSKVLSDSIVEEPAAKTDTIKRTENLDITKTNGLSDDLDSIDLETVYTGDLDNFDIDKFLEELDFDT